MPPKERKKKNDGVAYGEVKLPCPVEMSMAMLRDVVALATIDLRGREAIKAVLPKGCASVVFNNPRGGADDPTAQLAVNIMALLCGPEN